MAVYKNLDGKKVTITNRDSMYYGEWGIVDGNDGNDYYIRIANDPKSAPVFDRSEFKVSRDRGASKNGRS